MAFTIDTSEVTALGAQLSAAGARTETMARMAVAKTAKDLERIAKVFVHKDTHATENSISMSMAISGHGLSATVGPTTDYAVYLPYKSGANTVYTPAYSINQDGRRLWLSATVDF